MNKYLRVKWFSILICVSLMFGLLISPVSAMHLATSAFDGDGLMTVSPTSNVTYGIAVPLLTFTFSANHDFGATSQVSLSIPSDWSAPTTAAGAGHIAWSAGTCTLNGAPPVAISGKDILIDITSCTTGSSFTITYANAIPGPPGTDTFLTQTDIGTGGGGLTLISAGSPSLTVDPKPLTVSAAGLTPSNKIYDGLTPTSLTIGAPTLVGIVSPDVVTLVTSAAAADFSNPNAGTGKLVNISGLTLGGTNASNYSIVQPTRSANITKRPITFTAVTDSKTYDGNTTSIVIPSITSGALQYNDTADVNQIYDNRNVGTTKVLTPVVLIHDGNNGLNYTVTVHTVSTGVINKLSIMVNAVTDTKFYDGGVSSNKAPFISPSLAGSDTSGFTQTYNNKSVGVNKTLTVAGKVNDGNNGANYTVELSATRKTGG